jgi:hypothetical protein
MAISHSISLSEEPFKFKWGAERDPDYETILEFPAWLRPNCEYDQGKEVSREVEIGAA